MPVSLLVGVDPQPFLAANILKIYMYKKLNSHGVGPPTFSEYVKNGL